MTRENKIQFGIILVAAMHSEIYDYDLEEGMRQALSDTFINEEELNSLPDERKDSYINFVERQKARLHKQALFLADAAINNISKFDVHQSISLQPFDPENPPSDGKPLYLIEEADYTYPLVCRLDLHKKMFISPIGSRFLRLISYIASSTRP